ncbi:MAG: hypothetical protein E7178_04660 [Erysipelotrichaceae bacterium]|nr:hypothetical protein [Erysipelotrichaceae bacterium]
MEEKNERRFRRRQPNSDTREELLVIMNYLQNYAYDIDHATTQTEIVRFAEKHYGLNIRRDRVGSILIHLEQISKQKPDLLPFTIDSISLNKIKRYYIPQKLMSADDIAKICSIIISDKKLSSAETKRLMDTLISTNTTKGQRKTIMDKINVREGKRKKLSDESYNTYELFNRLCESKRRMIFRLRDPSLAEYSKILDIETLNSLKDYTYAYPAFTYEIKEYTKYVIYIRRYQLGIITSIENLDIVDTNVPHSSMDDSVNYELDIEGEDKSLKTWVDNHYKGQDGILRTYKLKVLKNFKGEEDRKEFIDFVNEYNEYWPKPFEYTLLERNTKHVFSLDETEDIVVYDAVFEIEANRSSFEHWYLDKGNFDKAVILEPAMLNDIYLSEKVGRYATRINKYGKRYKFTVNRDYKPEYLERRNLARKRMLERRKQREAERNKESK